MQGCEQCIMSAKAQQQEFENVKFKARQYAKENKISVAIFKEGYTFQFIESQIAIAGQYPVIEFISEHS